MLVLLISLSLSLAGCSDARGRAEAQASARARVDELIEAVRPIEETVTSDVTDRWFHRKWALIGELREAGPAVGEAALEELSASEEDMLVVQVVLLDVAAYNLPEKTREALTKLVLEYGPHLGLRKEACRLLAKTSPQTAIEVFEPLLLDPPSGRTMPPAEFQVDAWVNACEATGHDPVRVLADVATNISMQQAARHRATRELGRHPGHASSKALEAILVESTGNAYMRRIAAQALRDSVPRERACSIFELVFSREADINFTAFLEDMITDNCR